MLTISLQAEERVVAELACLGVSYLSRLSDTQLAPALPPQALLVELLRQPSSRVRVALVALLLAHPEYAEFVPAALTRLTGPEAQTLKFFTCAAVYLQEQYAEPLHFFLGTRWRQLPDLFSSELGLSAGMPEARLRSLAKLHVRQSGQRLNWAGTYDNAARNLLRRWKMEQTWKQ